MQPDKPQLLSSGKITFPANETSVQDVIPFVNGDSSFVLQFSLVCSNLPVGTRISVSSPDPGPTPPIYIASTTVTTPAGFMVGITSEVPANYSTNLYFLAQMPYGVLSSPNMSVQVQVSVVR